MENSAKKALKKTTSTQFDVLVRQLEVNPHLARGAPIYGANRQAVDEAWRKIAAKVNSYGPPQRSAVEWKKIWADLKSRTKKKIADNNRSLTATGGGPFQSSPLTDLEQVIDRILLMSKSAAPSGAVFGIKRKERPTVAATTIQQAQQASTITPTRRTQPNIDTTPIRPTSQIGVVTPRRATPLPQSPETPCAFQSATIVETSTHSSPETTAVRRFSTRKRNFQETIGESAIEQAKAAKLQAEASMKIAEASIIQAEATKALSETMKEMLAVIKRQTTAIEDFIMLMKN